MDYTESVFKRLDRLKAKLSFESHTVEGVRLERRFERMRQRTRQGFQDDSEFFRLWIEEKIKDKINGRGLDIFCGDFPIVEAEGVDTDRGVLGVQWVTDAGNLYFCGDNCIDYIVTNYLEGCVDVITMFKEWHRVLKANGLLVFVCPDVHIKEYADPAGPLKNTRKRSCFTSKIIKFYLTRCNFSIKEFIVEGGMVCVVAIPK